MAIFFPPASPDESEFNGVHWQSWEKVPDEVSVETWRGDQDLLAHTQSGAALPVGELHVRRFCHLYEHGCRRDPDGDHRVGEAGAEKGRKRDREDEKRARKHRVGNTRDQRVDPAADVTGKQTDRHPERQRDAHRDEAGEAATPALPR